MSVPLVIESDAETEGDRRLAHRIRAALPSMFEFAGLALFALALLMAVIAVRVVMLMH